MKDRERSKSAWFLRADSKALVWYLHVPGHGVMVIRTTSDPADPAGKLIVHSGAALEKSEIGYSDDL